MFTYSGGVITDKGDVRTENQDSVLLLTGQIKGCNSALFVIADGMGGLSYGAQVSQYITGQFERWWHEDFPQMLQNEMDSETDIRELLEQEIWDINQAILNFKDKMRCRSGSTLSLLLLYKNQYFIENIGDSRIYLVRRNELMQLTRDQSLVAEMVENHQMTEEEARHSKIKNMLTMCIGMFSVPQSCYCTGKMYEGDCFLLCSDGLYHSLGHENMLELLWNSRLNAQEKAEKLRQMIGQGMARDNVSAIVAEVKKAEIRRIE